MEGGAPAGRGRGEGHNYFVIKEHHKRCGQVIIVTWVFLHQFVRGRISVDCYQKLESLWALKKKKKENWDLVDVMIDMLNLIEERIEISRHTFFMLNA